jgi:hypothetical protein
MLPADADHVTDLSAAVPTTVALNASFPPVVVAAEDGEMDTDVTVGAGGAAAVTLTLTDADLVVSALLVAVIVAVPALFGAVYPPAALMLPIEADHVTDLSAAVPCTLAVNVSVPFVLVDAETGEMATELTTGAEVVAFALTGEESPLACAIFAAETT